MTSLPISTECRDATLPFAVPGLPKPPSGTEGAEHLLQAFRSFAKVAGSLERSYGALQAEVERLRRQLAEKDWDLAQSVREKRSVRVELERILQGLPCGVLVISDPSEISRSNPEALQLLRGSSAPSRPVTSLHQLPGEVQRFLQDVRRQRGEHELSIAAPDGGWRCVAAHHAQISPTISVFILRDVTEHKRLEQTQAKMHRDQALAEMSAMLAHEIRNPLGSLELFAGLLADSKLDGECAKWIEHVQAGLRTLAATVNNVLHFHSQPRAEFGPMHCGELLEWVANFCGPLARQSGVTLSLQNGLREVSVSADRHRLEQVLLNLVLNSLRFLPTGGWIEIAGRKNASEDRVELAVADTGPGIPPAYLPRIFEAGFSSHAHSPGLGLAVCQKIVGQHGGQIRAANRPGGGAIFTVTLPFHACEQNRGAHE